jgi:hypothetical protein
MVERADPVLPVSQQCRLLAVPRSAVYRKPAEVSAEDLAVMTLVGISRRTRLRFTAWPWVASHATIRREP